MVYPGKKGCLGTLLALGGTVGDRESQAMREIIDDVLSCDKMVRCNDRLECTWLASQLADTMRRR